MYYQNGYVNTSFGFSQWRAYSEYNVLDGWALTGWAYNKKIPILSKIVGKCKKADINPFDWDSRWYVNGMTIILILR